MSQNMQCTCLLIVIAVILYEFVHILLRYNAITVSASEPQIVGNTELLNRDAVKSRSLRITTFIVFGTRARTPATLQ